MDKQKVAIANAQRVHRIYHDYWNTNLGNFNIVTEGYRYDDDNGVSVFLSYDGKVKATSS